MAIITTAINVHVYNENQHNFLFTPIEMWFDDDENISLDNYATWHKAKKVIAFLQERLMKSN